MKKTFIREDALPEEVEVILEEARKQPKAPEKKENPSNHYFG